MKTLGTVHVGVAEFLSFTYFWSSFTYFLFILYLLFVHPLPEILIFPFTREYCFCCGIPFTWPSNRLADKNKNSSTFISYYDHLVFKLFFVAFTICWDISSPKMKSLKNQLRWRCEKFRPTKIEKQPHYTLSLPPRLQTFIMAFTTLWTYLLQK